MVGKSSPESLCLNCGLCCDGTIFADVKLRPGDNALALKSRLLHSDSTAVKERRSRPQNLKRFPQPCPAFEACRCCVYPDRPTHCREFECLLLKSVKAGQTAPSAALRLIKQARRHANTVRRLLGELGNHDEGLPLRQRFQQVAKHLAPGKLEAGTADTYGQLTLAVHDLNLLLSEAFYPGDH